MNQPVRTLDLSRCPLCGQSNLCAMEQARLSGEPQQACWCSTLVFDPALSGRIPEALRGNVCLCQACALPPISNSTQGTACLLTTSN